MERSGQNKDVSPTMFDYAEKHVRDVMIVNNINRFEKFKKQSQGVKQNNTTQ
jgi:hypothetical protein